jgi:adenylate cyclase
LITNKKKYRRFILILIITSFFAAHLCFLLFPNLFKTWDAKAIDLLFLFRSSVQKLQPLYDDTIVHVDITDSSIDQLNNVYINRLHHAKVIKNLADMNVSTQLYDFLFATRRDAKEDTALIEASKNAQNVYFGLAFKFSNKDEQGEINKESRRYLENTKWKVTVEGDVEELYIGTNPLITFPDLASASKGVGFLNLTFDHDGVFRRIPLLIRYAGAFYPSFAFRGICEYLGVLPGKIIIKPGKSITLQGAKKPGESIGHDIVIPIDQQGNMLINFIGPWEAMKHYNFADVLYSSDDREEMELWKEELAGKIVVISEVFTGASDLSPVPTDSIYPLSGLHANAMHTILTESFLRELSSSEMILVDVILLAIIIFLSFRSSPIFFSIGSFGLMASYVFFVSASFFFSNLILDVIRPILTIFLALISILIYRYLSEAKERDFIRNTFGRYLSNEVVKELLESPEGLEMSGEIKEVTFLVSDLRGFTAISNKLNPREVIDILNHYLERMVGIITDYKGTVNEFEGDGILTFFGAPLSQRDDPERAIQCAIKMQKAMSELNQEQNRLTLPELHMGIGINTGEVVVGNIGSEKRSKYSAIGSAINTAYRIESYTTGGQILISQSTYERVKSSVRIEGTMKVQFKGIDHPVTLYNVIGMKQNRELSLPDKAVHPMVKLEFPVPITCFPIKGKTVSETFISGILTHLGEHEAEVSLEQQVEIHSNVKVLLAPEDSPEMAEVYAKVVSVEPSEATPYQLKARLEFTWLPDNVKTFFNNKRSVK